MSFIANFIFAINLFLLITYIGISISLYVTYKKWNELSIGLWAASSFIVGISLLFHIFSINFRSVIYFKISVILFFLSMTLFGSAQQIAKRGLFDVFITIILFFVFGLMAHVFLTTQLSGFILDIPVILPVNKMNSYYWTLLFYILIFYVVLGRDSEMIYQSTKEHISNIIKSPAITHLIAWQFFIVSLFGINFYQFIFYNPFFTSFSYLVPFIMLLVPILFLGSKPFLWTREGIEPETLILSDQWGNIVFSWMKNDTIPLLLEGQSMSTVVNMLENIIPQKVSSIEVEFKKYYLYIMTSNGFNSILITEGYHPSYKLMLQKIHSILLTNIIKQSESGIPGYDLPDELQWLLAQLLPEGWDNNIVINNRLEILEK